MLPIKKQKKPFKEEEQKMWAFLARQIRLQNENLHFPFGLELWKMYKDVAESERACNNLQSYFRRYMSENFANCELGPVDFFLILRFFQFKLTEKQRKEVEKKHNCELDYQDGVFVHAHFPENGGIFLPSKNDKKLLEFLKPITLAPSENKKHLERGKRKRRNSDDKENIHPAQMASIGEMDSDSDERNAEILESREICTNNRSDMAESILSVDEENQPGPSKRSKMECAKKGPGTSGNGTIRLAQNAEAVEIPAEKRHIMNTRWEIWLYRSGQNYQLKFFQIDEKKLHSKIPKELLGLDEVHLLLCNSRTFAYSHQLCNLILADDYNDVANVGEEEEAQVEAYFLRAGERVNSFCYILLDLPDNSSKMAFADFLTAVFYVGKSSSGKRPMEHFIAAKNVENVKEKDQKIRQIWAKNRGISVLKFAEYRCSDEAFLFEYSVILTLGKSNLTNERAGIKAVQLNNWTERQFSSLGARMLHQMYEVMKKKKPRPIYEINVEEEIQQKKRARDNI